MSIQLVMQPSFSTCGQACIAMLANVTSEETIKVMHTSEPTSIGQLIDALDYYGIKHTPKNTRISKKNPSVPDVAILTVHMPTYSHWTIYYNGAYYDPEFGLLNEYHPDGKITSFLEIYL